MSDFLFKAPDTFRDNAWIKDIAEYQSLYDRSIKDPEGFWADMAETFHWYQRSTSLRVTAVDCWTAI